MVSLQAYSVIAIMPCNKSRFSQSFLVRAQSCRDEGRSSSIVDANIIVLRERIEEIRKKESLERCSGWNYINFKPVKRDEQLFLQLVGTIGGTFGLTIFTCTLCLCIISLLLHI